MKSLEEARIAAFSLESGERRDLLDGGTSPRFAESGHLVFARSGSLVAAPFDPRRLEIRGQAVTVLDGVRQMFGGAALFSLARNGSLVYVAGTTEAGGATLVRVDRTGRVEPLTDDRRAFSEVRLSPDGQQLAVSIIGTPNDQVWLYDLARRALRPITFAWDNRVWAWTPDGKRIVFSSDKAGAFNLYWQSPEGGPAERLTESPWNQAGASLSPDGKSLVFEEAAESTRSDIWLLTLEPQRRVRPFIQTRFEEGDPAISPDGRWLAYTSDESGRDEVYLQSFPDLGRKWQVSTDGGGMPVWEPHGRELFYTSDARRKLMSVAIQSGAVPVGAPRLLFEGQHGDYAVTRDGRFIMAKLDPSRPKVGSITQITLVQNWFEELKRKVPTK
jgi:eukaryotic-like serine/threonine-protein kinase